MRGPALPSAHQAAGPAFSEDFKTATSYKERFNYGWSGEWNAGAMFGANRNDRHADHGMSCGNPNTSSRTIHLTSQQQAIDAAYYYCMPDGDPDKGHVMTTVNTEGYVTVWFSPMPTFRNVSKVCWDQNIRTSPIWAAASGPSSTSSRPLSMRERRNHAL